MTIQQQLAALGPTFEVDGVKWQRKYQVLKTPVGANFGEELIIIRYSHSINEVPCFAVTCRKVGFFGVQIINCATIEAACRQALQLCRERVAELGKALGMVPTEADINTAAEIYAEQENNCYTADLYGFQHGAKYAMNFNQSTGEKE